MARAQREAEVGAWNARFVRLSLAHLVWWPNVGLLRGTAGTLELQLINVRVHQCALTVEYVRNRPTAQMGKQNLVACPRPLSSPFV